MSFSDARPPKKKSTASLTGIRVTLRPMSEKSTSIWLTFSEDALEDLFGKIPVIGRKCRIGIGRAADQGKITLRLTEDDDPKGLEITGMLKGSAKVNIEIWDLLPPGRQPGSDCFIDGRSDDGLVILRLPGWAQPGAPKARLDQEFGLKSVSRTG